MKKPKVKIENWHLIYFDKRKISTMYLTGEVQNHPKIKDGRRINAEFITKINKKKYKYAETEKIKYVLGKPSIHWVKWLLENNHESGKILKEKWGI